MNPAMWISKTGVQAQDAQLQAIANNLANANTVGYKRDRVMFEDLFYQVERQPGAQTGRTPGSKGAKLEPLISRAGRHDKGNPAQRVCHELRGASVAGAVDPSARPYG